MLDAKTSEAHKILESIPLRVKHSDKRDFLGMVVKNHVLELENNELNFNLKLQEKMNKILSTECQRLKKMMKNNNISLTEDDDDEDVRDSDDGSPDHGGNRAMHRGYRNGNDRIEEVEESRGSYLTENVDHNSQKATDKKVLQNSRTEGRPPVKRNVDKVNTSNHEQRNHSPDRGGARGGSKNKNQGKSEVDKIRNEIAHAQEVINSLQIPAHLQNKIASKKNEQDFGIRGTAIGGKGEIHPSTSSGQVRGRPVKERSLSRGIKANIAKKPDTRTDRSRDLKKKGK